MHQSVHQSKKYLSLPSLLEEKQSNSKFNQSPSLPNLCSSLNEIRSKSASDSSSNDQNDSQHQEDIQNETDQDIHFDIPDEEIFLEPTQIKFTSQAPSTSSSSFSMNHSISASSNKRHIFTPMKTNKPSFRNTSSRQKQLQNFNNQNQSIMSQQKLDELVDQVIFPVSKPEYSLFALNPPTTKYKKLHSNLSYNNTFTDQKKLKYLSKQVMQTNVKKDSAFLTNNGAVNKEKKYVPKPLKRPSQISSALRRQMQKSNTSVQRLNSGKPLSALSRETQVCSSAAEDGKSKNYGPTHILPQVIEFKDCIPGQMYSKKVHVINVYDTRSKFSLQPADNEWSNFVTFSTTESEILPPGLRWSLDVSFFMPRDSKQSVETYFTICDPKTAEPFKIPILAYPLVKYVWLTIDKNRFSICPGLEEISSILDFGKLKISTAASKTLLIKNNLDDDAHFSFKFNGETHSKGTLENGTATAQQLSMNAETTNTKADSNSITSYIQTISDRNSSPMNSSNSHDNNNSKEKKLNNNPLPASYSSPQQQQQQQSLSRSNISMNDHSKDLKQQNTSFQVSVEEMTLSPGKEAEVMITLNINHEGIVHDVLEILKDGQVIAKIFMDGEGVGDLIQISKDHIDIGQYFPGQLFSDILKIENITNKFIEYHILLEQDHVNLDEIEDDELPLQYYNEIGDSSVANSCYDHLNKLGKNTKQTASSLAINHSQLKHGVFIEKLGAEIDIYPQSGLLNKRESVEVSIQFYQKDSKKQHNTAFSLSMKIRWHQGEFKGEIKIPTFGTICRGDVYLSFDKNFEKIIFPNIASSLGQVVLPPPSPPSFTLFVYNPSLAIQKFYFKRVGLKTKTAVRFSCDSIEIPPKSNRPLTLTFDNLISGLNSVKFRAGSSPLHSIDFCFELLGIELPVLISNQNIAFNPIPLMNTFAQKIAIIFNNHKDPEGKYEYYYNIGLPKTIDSDVEDIAEDKDESLFWSFVDENFRVPLKVSPKSGLIHRAEQVSLNITAIPFLPNVPLSLQDGEGFEMDIAEGHELKKSKSVMRTDLKPAKENVKGNKNSKDAKENQSAANQANATIEKNLAHARSKLESFRETTIKCTLPCTIRRIPACHVRMQNLLEGVLPEDESEPQTIDLNVELPIIRPCFYVVDEKDLIVKNAIKVDFGRIVLGEMSSCKAPIKCLNDFTMSWELIKSNYNYLVQPKTFDLQKGDSEIEFIVQPTELGLMESEYVLIGPNVSVKIQFTAFCFQPQLELESYKLSFDYTLVGETMSKTIVVKNTVDVPITCAVKTLENSAFSSNLAELSIAANGVSELTITFKPTVEQLYYYERLQFLYSGCSKPLVLELFGKTSFTTGVIQGLDVDPTKLSNLVGTEFKIQDNYFSLLINLNTNSISSDVAHGGVTTANGSSGNNNGNVNVVVSTAAGASILNSTNVGGIDANNNNNNSLFGNSGNYSCTLRQPNFCTVTLKEGVGELVISNLKPVAKLENIQKKQTTGLYFMIEPFNQSFFFDEQSGKYIIQEEMLPFSHLIEPTSGTLEIGSSKKLNIKSMVSNNSLNQSLNSNVNGNVLNNSNSSTTNTDSSHAQNVVSNNNEGTSSTLAVKNQPNSRTTSFTTAAVNMNSTTNSSSSSATCSFYKITIQNVYKVVEPKGIQGPEDPTVYILKVQSSGG